MSFFSHIFKDNLSQTVVDLGFGKTPITTITMAHFLRKLNSRLHILGIDIDPVRVREAKEKNNKNILFRVGGFNIPVKEDEKNISLIRCFNVLRQYNVSSYFPALKLMSLNLNNNGIIVEGTSNESGNTWIANVYRKHKIDDGDHHLILEYIVLKINCKEEFDSAKLRAILPKNLIHKMNDENPISEFINDLETTYKIIISSSISNKKNLFSYVVSSMSNKYNIIITNKFLKLGFIIWNVDILKKKFNRIKL